MNFTNHYFEQEPIQEGPVADVIAGGPGTALKAGAKGLGRAIANVARGATGRMKTIAFEPGWLKVLRPVNQANYKKARDMYADWKNKKTKLGPKQNFSVTDVRDGRLGEFSKDEFTNLLKRYDAKVPADTINMEAKLPPRMSVYMLNNKGKIIFFDLPIGDDGKKRYYAMGLDNKAERAFTLIHGMRFDDFVMDPSEEAGSEAADKAEKEKAGIEKIVGKVKISPNKYKELAPESRKYKNQLVERTNYLLDLFEDEEVINEAKEKYVYLDSSGDWMSAKKGVDYNYSENGFNSKYTFIAVPSKGNTTKDDTLQQELDKEMKDRDTIKEINGKKAVALEKGEWYYVNVLNKIRKDKPVSDDDFVKSDLIAVAGNKMDKSDQSQKDLDKTIEEKKKASSSTSSSTSATQQPSTNKGSLYDEIEDQLEGEPSKVKPDEKQEDGWRYETKDKGVLFLYKSKKDNKYYLSYNKPAEKTAKGLIDKYGLESAPETPED